MHFCLYCYLTSPGVYRQRQCWFHSSELQPVAVDNVPLLLSGAVFGAVLFSFSVKFTSFTKWPPKTVDVSFKIHVSLIVVFLLKSWCSLRAMALVSKDETGSNPFSD